MSRTKDPYTKVVDIFQESIKQKFQTLSAANSFTTVEISLSVNLFKKMKHVFPLRFIYAQAMTL